MSRTMNWNDPKKGKMNKNNEQPIYRKPSSDKYQVITHNQIAVLAKSGDEYATEFLIEKYENLVRLKAKSYFLVGADKEDVIQEGLIGLYKAIRDFNGESSFSTFAELCITRQIITAVKTATRQKHIPLNHYVSLDKPIYDEDSDVTMLDVLPSKLSDPQEIFISHELSNDLKERLMEDLSDLEAGVFLGYLEGKSYQEMAQELNTHVKSIDNALQRVKRKIEKGVGYGNYQDSSMPKREYNYHGRSANTRQEPEKQSIEEDDLSSLPIVRVSKKELAKIVSENRGRAIFSTPASDMIEEPVLKRPQKHPRIDHDYEWLLPEEPVNEPKDQFEESLDDHDKKSMIETLTKELFIEADKLQPILDFPEIIITEDRSKRTVRISHLNGHLEAYRDQEKYTLFEAAEILGLTEQDVSRLVEDGEIDSIAIPNKRDPTKSIIRIPDTGVEKYYLFLS